MRFALVLLPILAAACSRPLLVENLPDDLSNEPVFYGPRFEPPAGRVIHGWGQFSSEWLKSAREGEGDTADLDTYIGDVNPSAPAICSFYVAPELVRQFLRGFRYAVKMQGFFFAQVGLYFRGSEADLAAGKRDQQLRVLARTFRDFKQPVLLRIGYEFNNPWALYRPADYVVALRRVWRSRVRP